ncbi:MAG: hypothetical protein AB7V48_05730 [Sedimentibacter sp.]
MRYLQYRLHGFENITLTDNDYYPVNNHLFKSILLSDDVKQMTVGLKDGITYEEYKNEIDAYLNQICFNMIINSNVSLNAPYRTIEIIQDKEENNTQNEVRVFDYITFKDEIIIQRHIGAQSFYENIINQPTSMDKHFVLYERIFKTLFNPVKVVQFLSLYQLLYELLSKGKSHPAQRYVTEYIENNKDRYPAIEFKPSRKNNKKEDSMTYLRNEITHCEDTNDFNLYSQLGDQISDAVIKQIIIVLNDVIMELP